MHMENKRYGVICDPRLHNVPLFGGREIRRPISPPPVRVEHQRPPSYNTIQPVLPPPRAHIPQEFLSGLDPQFGSTAHNGYNDHSPAQQISHFDPTYRAHRRLVRAGIAATTVFAAAFVTWAVCFPLALFDLHPLVSPEGRRQARVAETVAVAIAALVYIIRVLVNLRVGAFLGRVLHIEKPMGCTQLHHGPCVNQRYLLYGGWGLELAIGLIMLMEVVLCGFTWSLNI
ncbi:hypothetical protein TWF696_000095 [Orbilia brochopaga]|uniref:Uncharacterized protein n=1 Tax=Orbilia brochopaga TaxID=3140254 RepID=A0AAV9VA79_9PEZI